MLAQESITATHAHPGALYDIFFYPMIYLPGFSKESHRTALIGPVDTMEDLERKWPAILAQKPDLIKTFLVYSDEYDKRKSDPAYGWMVRATYRSSTRLSSADRRSQTSRIRRPAVRTPSMATAREHSRLSFGMVGRLSLWTLLSSTTAEKLTPWYSHRRVRLGRLLRAV